MADPVIIEEPSRFAEVSLIGFTNGTIIALIALGYTLVYGIIELINFAHGDNFMLGSFQTNSITDGSFQIPLYPTTLVLGIPLVRPPSADPAGQRFYSILMALLFSMLFCMVINVTIEYVGYRPCATSRDSPR